MIRMLPLVLLGCQLIGRAVVAQTAPSDCRGRAQRVLDSLTLAQVSEWGDTVHGESVLAAIRAIRGRYPFDGNAAHAGELASFDGPWRVDSSRLELQLADIITRHHEDMPNAGLAIGDAVWLYRHYSGNPMPLFALARPPMISDRFLVDVLTAMRSPLPEPAELGVLAYACTSAWILRAWLADTTVPKVSVALSSAVDAADAVIPAAYRLLNPAHKAEMRTFTTGLGNGYGLRWLNGGQVDTRANP